MSKRIYETPIAFKEAIDSFLNCFPSIEQTLKRKEKEGCFYVPTIEEMYLSLGFRSHRSLKDYENLGGDFAVAVKLGRETVYEYQVALVNAGLLTRTLFRNRTI